MIRLPPQLEGHSGRSRSVWTAGCESIRREPLTSDARADVCVVGAGISGLTTAYLLALDGRRVIVIDDGPVAGGETERTTAHLVDALDDRYYELERLHGSEGARLAAQSHSAAIDTIEKIVRDEAIQCEFERLDGYLFLPDGVDASLLDRELAAARRAGLGSVARIERTPLPSYDTGPCLRFPRQGQLHPLQYLAGLVLAIERLAGRIFTGTHVTGIHGGKFARVEANGHRVTTQAVVVATNSPINQRIGIHPKQAAYRSYVIAAPVDGELVAKALYWDACATGGGECAPGSSYHYVRLAQHPTRSGSHLLIVGGEDHKTGQADDADERYRRLEAWASERFPITGATEFRWSGQVLEPADSLAFIGRDPSEEANVYIASGDSGNGMTHGTIAGMLISDLIAGRPNPWTKLYDPGRITLRSLPNLVHENLNATAQLKEWVTPGSRDSVDQIPAGCGAVLRKGLSKIAAYRDDDGELVLLSAVCPHLQCIVAWNSSERTWDCPCHGSRFDARGRVVNGPAISDLSPHESDEAVGEVEIRHEEGVPHA